MGGLGKDLKALRVDSGDLLSKIESIQASMSVFLEIELIASSME
jgi:hypothetical protein